MSYEQKSSIVVTVNTAASNLYFVGIVKVAGVRKTPVITRTTSFGLGKVTATATDGLRDTTDTVSDNKNVGKEIYTRMS